MRIYTLWHARDDGEGPWLCDAADQYTIDANGAFPPPYLEKRADAQVRELIIRVSEDAVRALFSTPSVRGDILKPGPKTRDVPDALLLTAQECGCVTVTRITDRDYRYKEAPFEMCLAISCTGEACELAHLRAGARTMTPTELTDNDFWAFSRQLRRDMDHLDGREWQEAQDLRDDCYQGSVNNDLTARIHVAAALNARCTRTDRKKRKEVE